MALHVFQTLHSLKGALLFFFFGGGWCDGSDMSCLYSVLSYHALIYSVIVELRDMKLQEKKIKEKCKQEDGIVSAVSLWTNEILPNWETM